MTDSSVAAPSAFPSDRRQLVPIALRYQFMPPECMVGDPMDTAHIYDHRAINVTWRGGDRWAIESGHGWSMQDVWCERSGEWEIEPQPSSRDAEFKDRTRYSFGDAITIAMRLANEEATDG